MKEMRFYTVEGNENVAYETVEQARKNVNGIWENTPWGYTEKLNYEIIETVINANGKITGTYIYKVCFTQVFDIHSRCFTFESRFANHSTVDFSPRLIISSSLWHIWMAQAIYITIATFTTS